MAEPLQLLLQPPPLAHPDRCATNQGAASGCNASQKLSPQLIDCRHLLGAEAAAAASVQQLVKEQLYHVGRSCYCSKSSAAAAPDAPKLMQEPLRPCAQLD